MSGYLIDTNVVSIFAPGRPAAPEVLRQWMITNGADGLYISAITIAEIRRGIRKLIRKGSITKAGLLEDWMQGLILEFSDRIVPVDIETALLAGDLSDDTEGKGLAPGFADILIAACARSRGLTVITLNTRHFEHLGVAVELPPG